MAKSTMKIGIACITGLLATGCVVYERPEPVAVVQQPAVVEEHPVIVGPGVEVIEVEPAPVERVYVYDPGFPPGVYFCNGFYWYGGYRYEHDVFINQYVTVNVRENRYTNVEENRRAGAQIEVQHRQEYAVNHGQRPHPAALAPEHAAARSPAAQQTPAYVGHDREAQAAPGRFDDQTAARRAPDHTPKLQNSDKRSRQGTEANAGY